MIRAPSSGWLRITDHSAAVSGPSFRSTASGTPILPMSWSSAAWPTKSSSSPVMPSCSAITREVGLLERGVLANDDVARLLEPEHRMLREENEEQRRETERRQRDAVGPEGSDRHGHEREDELEREVLPVEQTRLARR